MILQIKTVKAGETVGYSRKGIVNADKRIVIKNGGISKIIETTAKEKACIEKIRQLDETLLNIRSRLRLGDLIENIN